MSPVWGTVRVWGPGRTVRSGRTVWVGRPRTTRSRRGPRGPTQRKTVLLLVRPSWGRDTTVVRGGRETWFRTPTPEVTSSSVGSLTLSPPTLSPRWGKLWGSSYTSGSPTCLPGTGKGGSESREAPVVPPSLGPVLPRRSLPPGTVGAGGHPKGGVEIGATVERYTGVLDTVLVTRVPTPTVVGEVPYQGPPRSFQRSSHGPSRVVLGTPLHFPPSNI